MPVLCYHSVSDDWDSPLAVDTERFESQCRWIRQRFRPVDLATAIGQTDRKGRLPGRMISLTFDDGFADNFDDALPVLQRHGLTAAMFVVAATLDRGHAVDWVDTPPPFPLKTMSANQVVALRDEGMVIGSHSLYHKDLTTLPFDELVEDLKESRQILEDLLTGPVPYLAYPRGRWNPTVADAARSAGYTHAFALPTGPEEVGRFSLPRVGIYRGNGPIRFALKASRWYQVARTSAAYQALGR